MAQDVRSCGLGRSRHIGLPRTHLQHWMAAAATNLERLRQRLAGERQAVIPRSAFARLFPATQPNSAGAFAAIIKAAEGPIWFDNDTHFSSRIERCMMGCLDLATVSQGCWMERHDRTDERSQMAQS